MSEQLVNTYVCLLCMGGKPKVKLLSNDFSLKNTCCSSLEEKVEDCCELFDMADDYIRISVSSPESYASNDFTFEWPVIFLICVSTNPDFFNFLTDVFLAD